MYVFSLVLCLWDAPNRSEEQGDAINALLFHVSLLLLRLHQRVFHNFPRRLTLLSAPVSRPLVMLALLLLLLLSARTG